jgi:hypothetical protein
VWQVVGAVQRLAGGMPFRIASFPIAGALLLALLAVRFVALSFVLFISPWPPNNCRKVEPTD